MATSAQKSNIEFQQISIRYIWNLQLFVPGIMEALVMISNTFLDYFLTSDHKSQIPVL